MKHFLGFVVAVSAILFLFFIRTNQNTTKKQAAKTLRVFGYSSFTGKYGPGPELKNLFESTCDCKVEYIEGSDSGIILQRLKIEGASLGADLIIGLDQYDLSKGLAGFKWRKINLAGMNFDDKAKAALVSPYFIPYDWGTLAFVAHKDNKDYPKKLDDLLDPKWKGKIALQDPRTSSPGLQFLIWVLKIKGQEEGFRFMGKMIDQAHSFSSSWSTAYGLFQKKQADLVFSYVTSPLYHLIEENNPDFQALSFSDEHPNQFEFMGVPEFCQSCDLSEKFINLVMSPEGQKIIMMKNWMFPVVSGVKEGTPFANVVGFKSSGQVDMTSEQELEKILKKWAEIRRGD